MAKEGDWEDWGFNDTFKVSLTGQAKDVSSAVKELKQAFPKNEVKKYSTKSLYVFVYDNEVPIVKKIAKMFNVSPQAILMRKFSEKGGDFESFKKWLRVLWKEESYKNEDAKNWSAFSEIPTKEARALIKLVNND